MDEIPIVDDYSIVLITPDFSISTAEAYARLKISLTTSSTKPTLNWKATSVELLALLDSVGNDFQELVTDSYPAVALCMHFLREAGAHTVALSGSGSAFFGLFDRAPDPSIAAMISGRFGWQAYCLRPVKLA